MIESFRHKGLRRLYLEGNRSRLSQDLVDRIEDVLVALDTAKEIGWLDRPGFRLHALKGDMKGHWSISVSANWRVTFRFEEGSAYDVDLVDYH